MSGIIRGLTLWRPWSWAVACAGKRVENRGWPPPRWLLGQYLAIHGGKKYDREAAEDIADIFRLVVPEDSWCDQGIVAVARVVGYYADELHEDRPGQLLGDLPKDQHHWYCGPFAWALDNVCPIMPAIPCRGAQGLWEVPPDVLAVLRERWRASTHGRGVCENTGCPECYQQPGEAP